ncbi:MAG: hypothetical protein ABSA83_22315 [Verrucomicrobiota bacterium]|jgi:hypothetical protein
MNTNLITDRFGTSAFRAELPSAPHNTTAQFTRRAAGLLRFGDRWRYAPRSAIIAIIATSCLLAGVLSNNAILVLIGCLGLPFALYYLLRLSPLQLEQRAAQVESDCDRTVTQFENACRVAVASFASTAFMGVQRECQSAVANGFSLAAIADFKKDVKEAFVLSESNASKELAARQQNVTICREQLQRKRNVFAAVCQQRKSALVAGPARRVAREVIESLASLSEARLNEVAMKAEAQAFHEIVERMEEAPQVTDQAPTLPAEAAYQLPVWLGTPMPSSPLKKAVFL